MRTQYSAPPTHHTDLLAHRQSEYPMVQTADSQPPQTSHAESDQTTSELLQKLPTQLNTPNILVANLVRVWLGRCVSTFRGKWWPQVWQLAISICRKVWWKFGSCKDVRIVFGRYSVFHTCSLLGWATRIYLGTHLKKCYRLILLFSIRLREGRHPWLIEEVKLNKCNY